ncbi:hypothetical protein MKW92_023360 [Papaver armeniacum]|nr:hypothetical protein MKW92_023360 [Papaver armeniacum]
MDIMLFEMSRRLDVYFQIMLSNEDPRLNTLDLDEVSTSFCRSPLHNAVMCGDTKFAEKIVSIRGDLALKTDSQGFTPLHLASARTSLRMVKLLVEANSDACVYQDQDGRTPVHVAAMKDHTKIMEVMIEKRPEAVHLRHDRDENILHFCVKHNKFKALKLLVEYLISAQPANRNDISINSRDNDGNTILHLAAEMKKFKILNYLLQSKTLRIDINAVNNQNVRALNMLSETEKADLEFGFYHHLGRAKKQKKKASSRDDDDGEWLKERVNALMVVATLIAGIAFQAAINPPGGVWQEDTKVDSGTDPITFVYYIRHMFGWSISGYWGPYLQNHQNSSAGEGTNSYYANNTLVVPPNNLYDFIESLELLSINQTKNMYGGLITADDDFRNIVSNYNDSGNSVFPYLIRYAGYPILAYTYPLQYTIYMVTNTVAFLVSGTIILLVICGFMNDTSRAQVRLLVVLTSISIGCITFGYLTSFVAMIPDYFIGDPALYSIYGYTGLWGICGFCLFLSKLVSNIVKIQKRHLVGTHQYFKTLFHVGVKDASKWILFICGISLFFIVLGFTFNYSLFVYLHADLLA